MINTHWLELPLSRTYFYGSKGVRAIEVLLYVYLVTGIFFFLTKYLLNQVFDQHNINTILDHTLNNSLTPVPFIHKCCSVFIVTLFIHKTYHRSQLSRHRVQYKIDNQLLITILSKF